MLRLAHDRLRFGDWPFDMCRQCYRRINTLTLSTHPPQLNTRILSTDRKAGLHCQFAFERGEPYVTAWALTQPRLSSGPQSGKNRTTLSMYSGKEHGDKEVFEISPNMKH